ncbi:hypothetical protein GCM10020255_024110 [Rhodococcus baikonurensis]
MHKHTTHRMRRTAMRIGATVLAGAIAFGAAGTATAAPANHRAPAGGYEEVFVPSEMGPVKVQIQAARGGDAALYLLDGLRARDDVNGWTSKPTPRASSPTTTSLWSCRSAVSRASTPTGSHRRTSTAKA